MGHYALEYHHHLRKLVLLSPIGIREKPPGEPPIDPTPRLTGRYPVPPKFLRSFCEFCWETVKLSPLKINRYMPKPVVDKYIEETTEFHS